MCTSSSLVSQDSSSSNNADGGGHSGITTSTAADDGSVLGIESRVGGRSVGTSKLDDESERGRRGLSKRR